MQNRRHLSELDHAVKSATSGWRTLSRGGAKLEPPHPRRFAGSRNGGQFVDPGPKDRGSLMFSRSRQSSPSKRSLPAFPTKDAADGATGGRTMMIFGRAGTAEPGAIARRSRSKPLSLNYRMTRTSRSLKIRQPLFVRCHRNSCTTAPLRVLLRPTTR